MLRTAGKVAVALVVGLTVAACAGSGGKGAGPTTTSARAGPSPSSTTLPVRASACGGTATPPRTYQHVVVIMLENRTWPAVGGVGFAAMPYLHGLAANCAFFSDWVDTNPQQNSLTQYIGLTSGVDNPATVDDCDPSATCRSTDDNLFRQVRTAGGTARTFVEGATTGCSAAGNAAKHVPAMYYVGGADRAACPAEVRPLNELDVDHLPTFAMIIPNLCHDGHDCANDAVDAWLQVHLGSVLTGAGYRSGTTAVLVLYDEDRPVPNLLIAPTATAGPLNTPGAGHPAALRTIEAMLGLPTLPALDGAVDLRAPAHV